MRGLIRKLVILCVASASLVLSGEAAKSSEDLAASPPVIEGKRTDVAISGGDVLDSLRKPERSEENRFEASSGSEIEAIAGSGSGSPDLRGVYGATSAAAEPRPNRADAVPNNQGTAFSDDSPDSLSDAVEIAAPVEAEQIPDAVSTPALSKINSPADAESGIAGTVEVETEHEYRVNTTQPASNQPSSLEADAGLSNPVASQVDDVELDPAAGKNFEPVSVALQNQELLVESSFGRVFDLDAEIPPGYVQLSAGVYVPQAFLQFVHSAPVRSPARSGGQSARAALPAGPPIVRAAAGDRATLVASRYSQQSTSPYSQSPAHAVQHQWASPGLEGEFPLYPLPNIVRITSEYGDRIHPFTGRRRLHGGVDFGVPVGTPVLSSLTGVVQFAGWMRGYGYTVILQHERGAIQTLYAHLSAIHVRAGQEVLQGEMIALSGSSGLSTGPHLHFEIRAWNGREWVATDINQIVQYAQALKSAGYPTAQQQSSPHIMRVALQVDVPRFAVAVSEPALITSFDGRHLATLPSLQSLSVQRDGSSSIIVNGQRFPAGFFIEPQGGGVLAINGRWYRGRLLVAIRPGGLIAVNWIDLESYLLSVVGSEVYPSWNANALQAQAIAARSYALVHRQRPHNPEWFDVFATERHQAYRGIEREFSTTSQAVAATHGVVLTVGDRVVESLYAASQEIVNRAHRGRGMSQEGASVLAERGVSYGQILQHYYPGTTLSRLY